MLKKFTGNRNISKKSRLPVDLKSRALTSTVGVGGKDPTGSLLLWGCAMWGTVSAGGGE